MSKIQSFFLNFVHCVSKYDIHSHILLHVLTFNIQNRLFYHRNSVIMYNGFERPIFNTHIILLYWVRLMRWYKILTKPIMQCKFLKQIGFPSFLRRSKKVVFIFWPSLDFWNYLMFNIGIRFSSEFTLNLLFIQYAILCFWWKYIKTKLIFITFILLVMSSKNTITQKD